MGIKKNLYKVFWYNQIDEEATELSAQYWHQLTGTWFTVFSTCANNIAFTDISASITCVS